MTDFDYYDAHSGEGLSEADLELRYDEMLDAFYGEFMNTYPASRVLKEVDPIAYRCGFNDWLDSECENGIITEENPFPDEEA